jgi:hypothetical protein
MIKRTLFLTAITGCFTACSGPKHYKTPNLDRLAEIRVRFSYAYGYYSQLRAYIYYPDYLWLNEKKIDKARETGNILPRLRPNSLKE